MTTRRQFVGALAATAGVGVGFQPASVRPHRLARIGLELYSVRDAMRTDPDGTLAAVRRMGYDDVELLWSFGNFGRSTEQVRATLRRLDLRAPSAHIAPELLLDNWQASLDTARRLGHTYLVVPSLPDATRNSLDEWRRWADQFNQAGAAARRADLWLAFHNEPEHQHRIGDTIPYDLFIDRTDPGAVRLQLDVGNMLLGGGDPLEYLARHRARYWSFHLKDVVADRRHDTELGDGSFDFRRFLAAVPDLEHKPCYVEQEAAVQPLASADRDLRYLRNLRF